MIDEASRKEKHLKEDCFECADVLSFVSSFLEIIKSTVWRKMGFGAPTCAVLCVRACVRMVINP